MIDTAGHRTSSPRRRDASPFVPLLLLAVAVLAWFGFQTYQLASERQQLMQLRAGLDAQIEAAGKVRASLDTVAGATANLAEGGNINARILVAELRKRGITINPTGPASVAPK